MNNRFKVLLSISLLFTLTGALVFCSPRTACGASKDSAKEIVLDFPVDKNVGRIFVIDAPFLMNNKHLSGRPVAYCRGKVKVPAGKTLMMYASDELAENGSALDKLPVDAFAVMILSKTTVGDDVIAHIGRLTGLHYIDLESTDATDKGVACLASLVNLGHLTISHTMIKGATINKLGALKKLEFIDLGGNDLGPKVMEDLADLHLPNLLSINAARVHLKDASLLHLARIHSLASLAIMDNPDITDRGISVLKSLTHLITLDLRETAVTLKGVAALKGLPLLSIGMSKVKYLVADEKALKKIFPNLRIGYDDREKSVPVSVFDPLH